MPGQSPGPSIKNPRVYEALRRQGMSKQRAARISNAQARKRRKDVCTCKATPAAPAQPVAPAGGKGQSLGPGITRIRGNLCNVHGRYGPCDAALSKKPKGGKRAARAAKPKKTVQQRQQERQQQQAQNRQDALSKLRSKPNAASMAALDALTRGEAIDPDMAKALSQETGLVDLHDDGTATISPTGRAFLHALDRGDVGAAADALSRASDMQRGREERAGARTQRQQATAQRHAEAEARRQQAAAERTQRQQERAARQAKIEARRAKRGAAGGTNKPAAQPASRVPAASRPSAGGGGGGGGGSSSSGSSAAKPTPKQPEKQQPQTPTQKRDTNRATVRQAMADADQGIAPGGFDNLMRLGDGVEPDAQGADSLISMGLAERGSDGVLRLTAAARSAITAANRGDAKAAIDAISRAGERSKEMNIARWNGTTWTEKAGSPGDYLVVEDREKPSTWHLQVRTNGKPDHRLMGAAWAALHGGYRGNKYAGPNKSEAIGKLRALYASEKMPVPSEKESFVAQTELGQRLWELRQPTESFSVFKDASGVDRWFSTSSTAYRDRDQEIVSTKALSGAVALADASGLRGPLRFWHVPGVELGDCDYQATAQDGRFLIESGTFRSPELAAAVKAHADDYRVSIGFTHPADEPDSHGVFHNIAIFERSLVPAGRASNPFTHVAVKEQRMLTTEKETALRELLGGDNTLLQGLLGQVAQTDKAAQDQGVAYKDDTPAWAQALVTRIEALETTLKAAAPPVVEGSPEEEASEPQDEAMAEGDVGSENMLTDAEIGAIAQQTAQVLLDALMPHLGIGQKMDEVKSLLGGMAGSYAQKDAAIAEVKGDLEKVKAQVADLSGSQPRILAGGYRASQATATITTDETKLKEAVPAADPVAASFVGFLNELGLSGPVAGA